MAEVGAHRHHRPVSHPGAPGRAEHRTNLRPRHEPGRDGDRKPVDSAQVAYRRRREQCARLPAHDVVRGAYMVEMTNRFNPASRRSRRLSNRGSSGDRSHRSWLASHWWKAGARALRRAPLLR